MSFMLELLVPDLDWELAEQIEQATEGPGSLRIHACPRRRWLRPRRPSLWMEDELDEETPVLDDQADWGEHEFTLHPAGREALARSLRTLDAYSTPAGPSVHAGSATQSSGPSPCQRGS